MRSVQCRFIVASVLLMALCALSLSAGAQLFEKTDTQKEIELGREAARVVQAQTPLSKDKVMIERVRRIGSALVANIPQKAYTFEFKVLASPEYNAFCLPGGFMFVNEGLLVRLPDDNAVAWVMAHEITHAAHRHWARTHQKTSRDAVFGILFDLATGSNVGTQTVQQLNLRYSRNDETDADKSGMELTWAAGYDLQGALSAIKIMEEMEKGSHTPNYLRDHPPAKDRMKRAQEWIEDLKKRPKPAGPPTGANADVAQELRKLIGTPPTEETTSTPWFPLAAGNDWRYQVSSGGSRTFYTQRISGSIPLARGTVFRASRIIGDRGTEIPFQILTTAQGVLCRYRPSVSESPWKVEYALNLEENKALEQDGTTYTLLPPEEVSVPAGKFTDILKIRKKTAQYTIDLWFGRGVGLVKSFCMETGVTETLVSYHVTSANEEKH